MRDELLNGELFCCLAEAKVLVEQWRKTYNHIRPHSALGYLAISARGRRACNPRPHDISTREKPSKTNSKSGTTLRGRSGFQDFGKFWDGGQLEGQRLLPLQTSGEFFL